MKTKIFALLHIYIISALFSVSCVRDVVLDAGEAKKVVVECVLTENDVQELYLNFTKGASEAEAEQLTDAVAVLIDLTESKTIGRFVRREGDLWTLGYKAVQDHHYRLEIEVPGYDLIWAEETMPRRINVKVSGNYYTFCEDFSSPLWIYGINMAFKDWETRIGPVASEIFTDLQNVDKFNATDKVYLPYLKKEQNGVWTYCPSLIGACTHNYFLRINGGKADKTFQIGCNFSYTGDGSGWARPMIFMSLSDIYDQYLKTAFIVAGMKDSSDMSAVYLRDNLPSNIHGGIGVFGGKVQWDLDCWWSSSFIPIEEYPKFGIDKETHKFIED